MRRAVVIVMVGIAVGIATLFAVTQAAATTSAQTPEQALGRYLASVVRGDEAAALRAWGPYESSNRDMVDALASRRSSLTRELAAARAVGYRVIDVERWRMCCMPGLAERPEHAGMARMRVALDLPDGTRELTFDVWKVPDCCAGDPFDFRPRFWVLRDAYPVAKLPLAFPIVYDPAIGDTRGVRWPSEP